MRAGAGRRVLVAGFFRPADDLLEPPGLLNRLEDLPAAGFLSPVDERLEVAGFFNPVADLLAPAGFFKPVDDLLAPAGFFRPVDDLLAGGWPGLRSREDDAPALGGCPGLRR
jgi:hypothetical protein